MLQIAANWIAQEEKNIAAAKEAYMAEQCPAPSLSGDQATLMVRNALVSQQQRFRPPARSPLISGPPRKPTRNLSGGFKLTLALTLWHICRKAFLKPTKPN